MKRIFAFLLFVFIMNAGFTQSFYNGDLEKWDSIHSTSTSNYWFQPSSEGTNWLGTLNSLAGLPSTAAGPITCEKTSDAYSGAYAAKLISHPMALGEQITIFIPGMLGTAVMDDPNVRAIIGNPCAGCKPLHFKGYYKYTPVGSDSCIMLAVVTRWNTELGKRDTIGAGAVLQREAVSVYTPFDVALSYFSAESPDTLSFLMVASAGINLSNFMGCQGQVGSALYVDDLSLDYPAGFEQSLMPEVGVKAYPNPASDQINFLLSKKVDNSVIEMYSADGKLVKTLSASDLTISVSLSGLSSGSYFYKLKEGKHLLNSGTFVIN
jgi:hypothetical protein